MWSAPPPSRDIPKFRRDPCARDVALDPGGTTMPRMTALHMLGSTIATVSAPPSSSFRGSLPHPTQPLCTLRVRRHRRLTQYSLPGGSLGLTWAGLAPADRASRWPKALLDRASKNPSAHRCSMASTRAGLSSRMASRARSKVKSK
jgi:hypothetical protein